jgi:hypothetical protein
MDTPKVRVVYMQGNRNYINVWTFADYFEAFTFFESLVGFYMGSFE